MTPLDCTDIKALLSGLIDDRLDAHTRHQVERHLVECEKCRAQVNEAERLDSLIAQSAEIALQSEQDLPGGFINAVLTRTVRAEEQGNLVFRNAVTWTGWFAAAASIALAAVIWFTEGWGREQGTGDGGQGLAGVLTQPASYAAPAYATGVNLRSSTYEGSFASADVFRRAPVMDSEFAFALSEPRASARGYRAVPAITRDEADAIYNVSLLMRVLADADEETLDDVERVRQVALADHLIERLAETRERIDPEDRPALLAAESMLVRVAHGPVEPEDVRFLRETAASLDLAAQIGEITRRWDEQHRL